MRLQTIVMAIIGIIITLVGFVVWGKYSFDKQVSNETAALSQVENPVEISNSLVAEMSTLPEPVQRYFNHVLSENSEPIRYVYLKQAGEFRQDANQSWMPFEADQFFTGGKPNFIWYATVRSNPLLWINTRDRYVNGQGNMLIKLLSTATVADAKGEEMDISSLIRYLSEAPWFPTALLPSDYLHWEPIDATSARAIIQDHGMEASAVFYFNEDGEITRMVSEDRYMTVGDQMIRAKWGGTYSSYKMVENNLLIPTQAEAMWFLNEGDFSYAKITITEIHYNNPEYFLR